MDSGMNKFVGKCKNCQMAKQPKHSKVGAYSVKLPLTPCYKMFLCGNNCILILVDGFCKYSCLLPLRDMKARNIVKALVYMAWKVFGSPEQLDTDNAKQLKLCFQWGIKHINTSPYYPCPNFVEILNKSIMVTLSFLHNLFMLLTRLCISRDGFSPNKIFLDANSYQAGDLVACSCKKMEHFSAKLCMPYDGPKKILRFLGLVTVLLGDL
ncbi:hypothetical protein PR048_013137 [Dryococelus australis]|uniref:Integrase catalytic domain-containing protein n=1 Tax=Dryococelus australis TaxID=614101 RepID=A0ABQ9HRA5_9NEOP|nr:hypothetical protein PR048_013137 [Dryococelus australis]